MYPTDNFYRFNLQNVSGIINRDEKTDILADIENSFMIGRIYNELPLVWRTLNLLANFLPRLRHVAECFKRMYVD